MLVLYLTQEVFVLQSHEEDAAYITYHDAFIIKKSLYYVKESNKYFAVFKIVELYSSFFVFTFGVGAFGFSPL